VDSMDISRQSNGQAYDITYCMNARASAFNELEHRITVPSELEPIILVTHTPHRACHPD
jgi:hypothetical protein